MELWSTNMARWQARLAWLRKFMRSPPRPLPFVSFACGTRHLAVQLADPRASAAAQSPVPPAR